MVPCHGVCQKQGDYSPHANGLRYELVAAENENNKERTNNQTSHKYPANDPSP